MRDIRRYLPTLVLTLGCAFVWNARAQLAVPLVAPLSGVLTEVSGYRTEDQRLSDAEREIAGMTDYVARVYWRDSRPAFTTFVSYYERQTQGRTIHSPRNCLPGAGWDVVSAGTQVVMVDGRQVTLNRSVIKNGAATAVVFYWYQGRGRIVADEYVVKWNLLRDAALAGHTEEALVRVVVPVRSARPLAGSEDDRRMLAKASSLGEGISIRLTREVARALPRG